MTREDVQLWRRRQRAVAGVLALVGGWGMIQFAVGGIAPREREARYAPEIVLPSSCTIEVEEVMMLNWAEMDGAEAMKACLVIVAREMDGSEELATLLRNSGFSAVTPFVRDRRDIATMSDVTEIGVSATMSDDRYPPQIASWWVRLISWQFGIEVLFGGPAGQEYPLATAHFQIN
jgi:hypothetical protein